jgi:hypothetical protein
VQGGCGWDRSVSLVKQADKSVAAVGVVRTPYDEAVPLEAWVADAEPDESGSLGAGDVGAPGRACEARCDVLRRRTDLKLRRPSFAHVGRR